MKSFGFIMQKDYYYYFLFFRPVKSVFFDPLKHFKMKNKRSESIVYTFRNKSLNGVIWMKNTN